MFKKCSDPFCDREAMAGLEAKLSEGEDWAMEVCAEHSAEVAKAAMEVLGAVTILKLEREE